MHNISISHSCEILIIYQKPNSFLLVLELYNTSIYRLTNACFIANYRSRECNTGRKATERRILRDSKNIKRPKSFQRKQ